MNKYQLFALNNAGYIIYKDEACKERIDDNKDWNIINEDCKITLVQDENYNITKYYLRFEKTVSMVKVADKIYEQEKNKDLDYYECVIVPLDFNNKVNFIDLHFNNVVDPIIINIDYIEVDHSIYDDKMERERQSKLEQNACIKVSTGADLVNIYFQPCCDDYDNTIVELYLADGKYSDPPSAMGKHDVWHPQLLSATPRQMMGKFKVEEGMFFKSIAGLARGAYGYRLSQYDSQGNLLFKTDFSYFKIN